MRASAIARLDRLENLVASALARSGSGDTLAQELQYTYVYRPGVPAAGPNVYTTWPALYAATQRVQGPVLIEVDSSNAPANVPAGVYAFPDGVTFVARDLSSILTFQNGASFTSEQVNIGGVALLSNSTSPVYTYPGPNAFIHMYDDAFVSSNGGGAAAFFRVTVAGMGGLFVEGLSDFGDGADAALTVDVGATANITVASASVVLAHALVGAGTINLEITSDSRVVLPQAVAVLNVNLASTATDTAYLASTVANWSGTNPTSVANALDRIAAHVGPIP